MSAAFATSLFVHFELPFAHHIAKLRFFLTTFFGTAFLTLKLGLLAVLRGPRVSVVNLPKLRDRRHDHFSFARTRKRFPSPQCASAIQIVRPLEFTVETEPHFQPALLRLSTIISQHLKLGESSWVSRPHGNDKMI